MVCAHCGIAFTDKPASKSLGADSSGADYTLTVHTCADCGRYVILLTERIQHFHMVGEGGGGFPTWDENEYVVWPIGSMRPCPPEVPAEIAADFREAAAVLPVSPKASAALSRRCLQAVLRGQANVEPKSLYREIEEVLARGDLPSYVSDVLHGLREFGNLGAHPERLVETGEMISVESGEAEWMLGALEAVFDHYYVKPAQTRRRLEDLERKRHPLADAASQETDI